MGLEPSAADTRLQAFGRLRSINDAFASRFHLRTGWKRIEISFFLNPALKNMIWNSKKYGSTRESVLVRAILLGFPTWRSAFRSPGSMMVHHHWREYSPILGCCWQVDVFFRSNLGPSSQFYCWTCRTHGLGENPQETRHFLDSSFWENPCFPVFWVPLNQSSDVSSRENH